MAGITVLIVLVVFLAVGTLTITVLDSQTGTSFLFSIGYHVSLPDGEPVTIGNSRIIVLVFGDSVDTSEDRNKEKLVVGQTRVTSPHFARISTLGIPVIDTDFQNTLTDLGASMSNALFDLTVKTSKQIPGWVI